MEYKNLDHYRLKWFGTDEIRNLEEVREKLPFIKGFSFGPFVPYYLYLFFHNLWDLFILQYVSNFVIILVFYVGYFGYLFLHGFRNSYMEDPVQLVFLAVAVLLILIIQMVVLIYSGMHSRKLSWNRCEWKSYEAFEQGEKTWHIIGLILFILQMLTLLLVLVAGIFLYFRVLS